MEPFIDAHAHLLSNYDPKVLDHIAESGLVKQIWMLPVNVYAPKFHFAGDEQVLEVSKRYPGLFIPFGFIDYFKGPEQVDKFKEQGFLALKALRPPKDYNDESYFPIYERAEQLGMPILFHVGIISHRTRELLTKPILPGPSHMRPSMIDSIADSFPKLKLILGHLGTPWINETFETLFYYRNVCCTVTGFIDYDWLIHNLDRRTSYGETFASRMLFAVDTLYGDMPDWNRVLEMAEFSRMFYDHVGKSYRWHDEKENFMIGNAERLFPEFGSGN